jgi:hypothetical protein
VRKAIASRPEQGVLAHSELSRITLRAECDWLVVEVEAERPAGLVARVVTAALRADQRRAVILRPHRSMDGSKSRVRRFIFAESF